MLRPCLVAVAAILTASGCAGDGALSTEPGVALEVLVMVQELPAAGSGTAGTGSGTAGSGSGTAGTGSGTAGDSGTAGSGQTGTGGTGPAGDAAQARADAADWRAPATPPARASSGG